MRAEAGTNDLRSFTGLNKTYHPDGKSKLALRRLLIGFVCYKRRNFGK
jgi:hypothetical protein